MEVQEIINSDLKIQAKESMLKAALNSAFTSGRDKNIALDWLSVIFKARAEVKK